MTNLYTHIKTIQVPIWDTKIQIVLSNDTEKIEKKFPEIKWDYLYARSIHGALNGFTCFFIVLNLHNEYKKIRHGIIAHEALHITNYIMELCSVDGDLNNDEPLTYTLSWITDQVYKFLQQKDLLKEIGG